MNLLLRRIVAVWVVVAMVSSVAMADSPPPQLSAVGAAMEPFIGKEIAGAVTLVVTPEGVRHVQAQGFADVEKQKPMTPDAMFWIASMTKPVTAVAILILQEEGKLSIDEPAEKYVPELGRMKNADGSPLKTIITIKHLLTHAAGLPENSGGETRAAKNLQDVVTAFATKPMQFEPGTKWQYSQTGINSLGRIVEVISGQRFDEFLAERIFKPLGMPDTTFYPTAEQQKRLARSYRLDAGLLKPVENERFAGRDLADRNRVPLANGGLYSTAADYGRFARMLLNDGSLDGARILKSESVKRMASVQSGDLKTGFTPGNAWGLGVCVVRTPQGVTESLSPGAFGHGGAFGTQVWIDPAKKVAFILMVQRANFSNADASDVRRVFQGAAAKALEGAAAASPSAGATKPVAAAAGAGRRLGVRIIDLNTDDSREQIPHFGGNLLVNEVTPGSRAERLGLRTADAIKWINDKEMETVQDVLDAVRDSEKLKVEVIRGKQRYTFDEHEAPQPEQPRGL